MPDRRRLLQAAIGVPITMLSQGAAKRPTRLSKGAIRLVAVVRQQDGFVAVDPRTGETRPIALPPNTRRIHAHPATGSLLIEMASGSMRIRRNGDSRGDVEVLPTSPGSPSLVIAERVIGRDSHAAGVRTHHLRTGESSLVPSGLLPGPPNGWRVHHHPTLPAAVIDTRADGGGVVLLPAGAPGAPRECRVPPESSIGIAPDGNDIVWIDRVGGASALVCGPAVTGHRRHDPAPYLMLGADYAQVRGPIGGSGNLLLTVGRDWLPIVSCEASLPRLVNEAIVSGGDEDLVGFWWASPSGDAVLGELASGGFSSLFCWRIGNPPQMLPELPVTLAPGMESGGAGRWFHGADMSETSLGAGELRLMTIDMTSGDVVFDQIVDRRLELAATAVSDDGSLLAHCQSGNTAIDLLVAAFGDEVSGAHFGIDIEDAPVAAAEIVLDVVSAGVTGVVAAGLRWGNPDHHAPMVVISAVDDRAIAEPVRVDGELKGVVPFAWT